MKLSELLDAILSSREVYMNISGYKLDVIRQIVDELKQDYSSNEWTLVGPYFKEFKEFEADQVMRFSSFSAANTFIIKQVLKDLE
jgi:2-hydroxy-3-keto-5-methylthiopentenyl-1-phosphate phosphatase